MNSIPAPGIYENVSFADYLAWDCISNSSLQAALRSMLHYQQRQPSEETPAMRLGTLCHTGRLEPSAIYWRYVVMPDLTVGLLNDAGQPYDNPRATKAYKQRVAEFTKQHAAKQIVTQEEFDRMVGVVSALDRNRMSHDWFTATGPVELSVVWEDPVTGLRCKGRMDKWASSYGVVVDLKTTRDCLRFAAQIADRHYHRQGAMYVDGLKAATGATARFAMVAVESEPPHGVMAAPLRQADLERGRDEYRCLLKQIAEARNRGVWPGYSNPAEWCLPAWAACDVDAVTLTIHGSEVQL